MELATFELLCALPRAASPSQAQLEALNVLADAWAERGGFRLENGWWLEVFVRGSEFWRIDAVTSPDGFQLHLIDYDTGPLAELNEHEPPLDVEREVYGLGFPPGPGAR